LKQLTLFADPSGKLAIHDSRSNVTSVLFVCLGNIIRSPFCEGLFRLATGSQIRVDSAAIYTSNIDQPPAHNAQLLAKRYGFDISCHISRLITVHDFYSFDLLVALEPHVHKRLDELKPRSSCCRIVDLCPTGVSNPVGMDFSRFVNMGEQIERGMRDLLKRYFPQFTHSSW
jgi:protein-tyrosine phosphatase